MIPLQRIKPTNPGPGRRVAWAGLVLPVAGCSGAQSALAPAGRGAEAIAQLWWVLAGGALVIWVGVVGLAWYASRVRPDRHGERTGTVLIIGGGAILPAAVLGALLIYGLAMMPSLFALPGNGGMRVEVSGEQWWWRVRYVVPGREPIELGNEIHLPVGGRVELVVTSPDVIHSFWVPSIAGKMDMIPGRVNRLTLEPTRTGVFRGACAEYCGASHARMSFDVVVEDTAAFEAWLGRQALPARAPSTPATRRGRRLFLENGCGACHTIRGTPADGVVGPDLTHVGSRLNLAAGTLPNDADALARWIAGPERIKPGANMPGFGMLPDADVRALAAYLDSLE